MCIQKLHYGFKFFLIIFGFFMEVCHSVKITNLKVPSTYILEQTTKTPAALILDCEYLIRQDETGFVLKWLLDDSPVYQWIPSHKPYAASLIKNHINISYIASDEQFYKHSALAIVKPSWNLTGEYTCSVQTFQSSDKRSAFMQIVVPESDFQLNYKIHQNGLVNIKCSTSDIYPQPKLVLVYGEEKTLTVKNQSNLCEDGLYDTYVIGTIVKDSLESPTAINCILSIPKTNYTKRKETIYYDQVYISTNEPDDENGDISSSIACLESKYSNSSSGLQLIHTASLLIFLFIQLLL